MDIYVDQLAALAHPQRLALFRLLMRRYPQAVAAGELAQALDVRQNTLSAYLACLRQAGLIAQSRAGRSLLYRIEMAQAEALLAYLFDDCCRGRVAVCAQPQSDMPAQEHRMGDTPFHILFICTGNSARSIFAEAILNQLGQGRFVAHSAGTAPYSQLNPLAVQMLQDKGHDTAPLFAKNISHFQAENAPKMDFVFTVCDLAANEDCPAWPGQPITAHWGVPDPVKATGTQAQRMLEFQAAYGALYNRIAAFVALPIETLGRASLQAHLDAIAKEHPAQ